MPAILFLKFRQFMTRHVNFNCFWVLFLMARCLSQSLFTIWLWWRNFGVGPFSGSKLFDEHKESSEFSKNKTEKFGNLQREQIQEQDEFAGISLVHLMQ